MQDITHLKITVSVKVIKFRAEMAETCQPQASEPVLIKHTVVVDPIIITIITTTKSKEHCLQQVELQPMLIPFKNLSGTEIQNKMYLSLQ